MKIAYYHVYLPEDTSIWFHIVSEQLNAMESSGLLVALDELRVTCIARPDSIRFFEQFMLDDYSLPKMSLDYVKNPYATDAEMLQSLNGDKTITENYTYKKMYNDAWDTPNSQFLYIHTKGITSLIPGRCDIKTAKMYYYWRQYLNYGVIEKWKDCVDALETHDVAGINYYTKPTPHFSGGMWWANTNHMTNLPDPSENDWWKHIQSDTDDPWLKTCSDRFKDEMWLCMPGAYKAANTRHPTKVFNVFDLPQRSNPAATILPSSYYRGK